MKIAVMWPFNRSGTWLSCFFLAGSITFVVAAWRGVRSAMGLTEGGGHEALSVASWGVVDVLFVREVFLLAHLWFAVLLFRCLRTPSLLKQWRASITVGMILAVLVLGHGIAWYAARHDIRVGVPPW